MSNQSPRKFDPRSLGFLPELMLRIKLIYRLMVDPRVNPLLKILPIGALIYLIVPTDLMPLLPFDDAAVLWIGGSLFTELCPPEVVQEHTQALRLEAQRAEELKKQQDSVVDAEFREVGSKRAGGNKSEERNAPWR